MSLQIYPEKDFKGKPVNVKADTPDLSVLGILATAQSLKVSGVPWVVYSEKNYQGAFKCITEGSHSPVSQWISAIRSVRVVSGGLNSPNITLYEDVNYSGRAVPLHEAVTSLSTYDLDKKVSSSQVGSGAWILYSNNAYSGDKMITLVGDKIPNYSDLGWESKVSSLKPATGIND